MASQYVRSKARVRVRPKRYFCDPSLAAALLGATPERLLGDMQTLGMLFENLVLRDVRVFLSTYGGVDNSAHYFRDEKGLEVDLIVEHDGHWGAIEVKLSDAKADDGARNLKALERKVLSNPAAQNAAPAFLAVVVGKGGIAYTRDDGVAVIPMAAFGAWWFCGCAVPPLPKIHLLNPAPADRMRSTAAQVEWSWAAPLLGQEVSALMAATCYASNAA